MRSSRRLSSPACPLSFYCTTVRQIFQSRPCKLFVSARRKGDRMCKILRNRLHCQSESAIIELLGEAKPYSNTAPRGIAFQQNFFDRPSLSEGAKAIRTAGSNAEHGNFVALLNFISWLTKSRVPRAHDTCETINKSSKSNDSCYIDSFLFRRTLRRGGFGRAAKIRLCFPKCKVPPRCALSLGDFLVL